MPKRRSRPPKYRHYKPKNLAVVRIAGRDHYLGKYDSQASYQRYDRLVAEWMLTRQDHHVSNGGSSNLAGSAPVSVNALILAFWQYAEKRYVKNGEPTSEIRSYRTALQSFEYLS